MELDDTDVHTMSKLGQLALKMNQLGISERAFEKCLIRNENHWPSIDGILQILCLNGHVNEAYGWALHWYNKDNTYDRAIQVLLEITDRFSYNISFFEENWGGSFKPDKKIHKRSKESVFPEPSKVRVKEEVEKLKIDYNNFKLDKPDWLSLGKLIVKLYDHVKTEDVSTVC